VRGVYRPAAELCALQSTVLVVLSTHVLVPLLGTCFVLSLGPFRMF
jgi:hypothetical protein